MNTPVSTVSLLLSSTALLAACATGPRLDAEWSDANAASRAGLLRGPVLVACEAPDVALRNVCQDRVADEVRARGARPVFVPPETRLVQDQSLDAQLVPVARTQNAKAILVMSLRPAASEASGSGLSLGLGGFGFGRGGGSALGVGVAAPIGGTRVETGFAANGRVTSVEQSRLVWTATAAASPSIDYDAQLADLSRTVLDAAARAGLF